MKTERARAVVRGAVQGVGFRPFVFRLATLLDLRGWVRNSAQGVEIEAEGAKQNLNRFLARLETEKPPRAVIHALEFCLLESAGYEKFSILGSEHSGGKTALILPDLGTCAECLGEIFDVTNRRYRYPFTNCTHCGPRYSIIEALPYDRANTSMRAFTMCAACQREYADPHDRRFHAQPNACPHCGPHVQLWDRQGAVLACEDPAIQQAAAAIRSGQIVALQGIGGFQLLTAANNSVALASLRERKCRPDKPFALMFPSLEAVEAECRVTEAEAGLLRSAEAPIVLLERRSCVSSPSAAIAPLVAPGNFCLGVMLPYSPLHHLLMHDLGVPVVATSGNAHDEPICIDASDALERLKKIADLFLVHNRPIVRHVDDSVLRVVLGREMLLRRARGYAPLPVARFANAALAPASHHQGAQESAASGGLEDSATASLEGCATVLAVGAYQKNAVALCAGGSVSLGQHIGDLGTPQARAAFLKAAVDLPQLYDARPDVVACDCHPDYPSSRYARQLGAAVVLVQHHYAHVLACMEEHAIEAPALGVAWDGTGLGTDGTIWGGEFLFIDEAEFNRVGHLRTFRLPGGDSAVTQPRRAALGLLYEIFGQETFQRHDWLPVRSFSVSELGTLGQMLVRGLNAPVTSSAGRLFDVVASLVGLRHELTFEGQAAMELEHAAELSSNDVYPFDLPSGDILVVDWEPMIRAILEDVARGRPLELVASSFHHTLAEMIVEVARRVGETNVVLGGGCFQNKRLTERTVRRLTQEGFRPLWPQRVPPNDGGLALGQAAAALRLLRREHSLLGECVV